MFNAFAGAADAHILHSMPLGCFLNPATAGLESAAALKGLGDLPVLAGPFELPKRMPAESDVHVGWGSLRGNEADTLTFRLQLGPRLLYWLASAADPYVWQALRRWDEAGFMCLLAGDPTEGGVAALVRREFRLAPDYLRLDATGQASSTWSEQFARDCSNLLLGGALGRIASSDLPQWPKLKRVQGCAVSTPFSTPQ